MQIPLLDLKAQYEQIREEIEGPLLDFIKEQWFILGPAVECFEKAVAEYSSVEHAIGVSSGTDALLLAMMALDLGPGDEVITSPYTFFATAGCIQRVGAKPVFVDIDPDSYNLRSDLVKAAITSKTKAIVPVHLYGQCVEMQAILDVARENDIPVIEDAAQAIGSEYNGRRAGSMGEIGCFSFFPTKNLGACGDGGLVTCQDGELAEKIRILRVHGGAPKYCHGVIGGNFRLDALQAALIRPRLNRLDDSSLRRAKNAAAYTRLLTESGLTEGSSPALRLPETPPSRHIYNQYTLRCNGPESRDALREFLAENQVASEIYYPIPLHLQKCFSPLEGKIGDLPVAEKLSGEVLSIPVFAELEEEELCYVADRVEAFFKTS